MANALFQIIHEDPQLLVINKPAGLVCHPTKHGQHSSLVGRVRMYLGREATPHLINRLDRETSGVVIVAQSDDAVRELRLLWERREVEKEYWAIVHGFVSEEQGLVDAPLGKDETSRVAIKDCVREDGHPAQTEFRVVRRFARNLAGPTAARSFLHADRKLSGKVQQSDPAVASSASEPSLPQGHFTLLQVLPRTGRKHQIRIHMAHLGHPIVGDKIYGGDEDAYLALVEKRTTAAQQRQLMLPFHALHARALRFHWRGRRLEFVCNPEPWFVDFAAIS